MHRYLIAAGVAFWLASAGGSPSRAGESSTLTYEGSQGKVGDICVIGDRAFAIPAFAIPRPNRGGRDNEYWYWYVYGSDTGTAFHVAGDPAPGNRYLSFDPTGKSKAVMPVVQGAGSLWKKTDKSGVVTQHVTLQAISGPLKGWYLDYADEEVKINGLVAHPLVLSKEPRNIKEVIISEPDN